MVLRSIEKLKSALVLVPALPSADHPINVDQVEMNKYLRDPQIVQAPLGIQITSVRDQMVVQFAGQIILEDQSDVIPPSSGKLPEVANGIIQMLRRQGIEHYRAYGWNFDVAFDAPGEESAAALISTSFLNTKFLSDRAQVTALGAGVNVFFEQSGALCQLKLEPRLGDLNTPRFFAHINYHYEMGENDSPPDLDGLRLAYHGLWGSFLEILGKLVKP